ncbi:MAG: CDP-diacylglycerol--glycerol-3-phosphate 3-phosphatidyltransferase [Gammaproteobacteria bacterium]|nr:MAG: CDP-diacylglycerol--glycerol-3-phosphate 3-phosphatidyltransferase [Rhodobacteraceae bacterium TMED111]|tara:strand:- start:124 stop:657 length:534 start_codon:yes stop_codon:yes gene_type:complete
MIKFVNFLTIMRIIAAPVILFFLVVENYLICILLFFLASLTDYFDGFLARKHNAESELGEILDPIADKIIIVFLLIGLSVNLSNYLMAFLSSFIIAREIGIAALRDFASRNNLSDRTKVTFIAKAKTAIQLFTIGLYLLALTLNFNLLIIISDVFLIIATLITVYTGYDYILNVLKR